MNLIDIRKIPPLIVLGVVGFVGLSPAALAQDDATPVSAPTAFDLPKLRLPPGGILLAQDGDDSYDPFADYSEFDGESEEEEEDLHFFRNGRLFTVGMVGGYRGWTNTLGRIYSGDPNFGLFLTFFFDLRFAMQFGLTTGSHSLTIAGPNEQLIGNVTATDVSFNLKYYFNTQNVTRGLADLNPYIIGGFSQINRTTTLDISEEDVAKDSGFAANLGAGIEIPMMRNKMFFGLQGTYQMVNFPDENRFIKESDEVTNTVKPAGDSFTVFGILGVNF